MPSNTRGRSSGGREWWTTRYQDLFRFQAECARRTSDRFDADGGAMVRESVRGYYLEAECRPPRDRR